MLQVGENAPNLIIVRKPPPSLFDVFGPVHLTGHRVYNTDLTLAEVLDRPAARFVGIEKVGDDGCLRFDVADVPASVRKPGIQPPPVKVSAFFDAQHQNRLARVLVIYDLDSPSVPEGVRKNPLLARAKFDFVVAEFADVRIGKSVATVPFPIEATFQTAIGRLDVEVKTVDVGIDIPDAKFEIKPPDGARVQDLTADEPRS